jgi:hypothetical protein
MPFRLVVSFLSNVVGHNPAVSRCRLLTHMRHQCFGLSFPRVACQPPWGADVSKDEPDMAEASGYGAARSS